MTDLFGKPDPPPPAALPIPRKGGQSAMHGESGYARIAHDAYFTEPWCSRVLPAKYPLRGPIWEPACGDGRMARVLAERHEVISSDLIDHGCSDWVQLDFLEASEPPGGREIGAIVTNPPYELAEPFIRHALTLTRPFGGQVAMLLRNEWDCAAGRRELYEIMPLAMQITLVKRPKWQSDGGSPRHNFAWFVWDWQAKDLRRKCWGP